MNTNQNHTPALVKNGAGQLISERRARVRPPVRKRADHTQAVLSSITLALLDQRLQRDGAGFDPYNAKNRGDVWSIKRRD